MLRAGLDSWLLSATQSFDLRAIAGDPTHPQERFHQRRRNDPLVPSEYPPSQSPIRRFRLDAMPKQGITYEILIASPSDVVAEREIVSDCVRDWNSAFSTSGTQLRTVRWELDSIPAIGERAQAVLNHQLVDDADILVGIFKARFGSPTGISQSGTIEEIDRCIAAAKPAMLYFSTGPIPHNHDQEQLRLLRDYKNQIASRGIYAEFANDDELRQKVSRNLAAMMARLSATHAAAPVPRQSDLARVFIRSRPGERSGDVNTVKVSAVIENISPTRRISNYVVELSLPKACLTHTSAIIMGEVRQDPPNDRRVFRRSESEPGAVHYIFKGDKVPIFALDIGVDQLKMKETYLAGDYERIMADKVVVDAVIEGEQFRAERTIADIFANPVQG